MVKLVAEEDGSRIAWDLWDAADVVLTSRLAYPESRSALARARRAGRITEAGHSAAKAELIAHLGQTRIVDLTEEIARDAGDLAELFGLRGYDAVHLASATAAGDPEVVVTTWDLDMRRAATGMGFAVAGA